MPTNHKLEPLERVARKPRAARRNLYRWIKRGLLIGAGLGVIAMIIVAMLPEPVMVDAARVTRGPLEVEIREDGQTRVRDRFVIAAPISGELERIELEAGATVAPGTVVARLQPAVPALLDDRTRGETSARLAAARARERQAATTIARAKYARDAATRDAQRARDLETKDAIPKTERERYELAEQVAIEDLAAAELARTAARAEIEALRQVLEPRRATGKPLAVVAPTAGRVLRVVRESAGPVAAGTPLLEVGDPGALDAVIDVLSRDAERITPGMEVWLQTSSAKPLRATVRVVEPSAFTRISALGVEEQRVNVIARLDQPSTLGDAFRVDARIITWRADDVLRLPASALFRDRGRWAVYVVDADRAHIHHVDVGHRGRLDVEVLGGVSDGARVIIHPSDRVRDGVRVEVR